MEKHVCKGILKDGWIVYKCNKCSYIKIFSVCGSKMRTISEGDENVAHSGSFSPVNASLLGVNMQTELINKTKPEEWYIKTAMKVSKEIIMKLHQNEGKY